MPQIITNDILYLLLLDRAEIICQPQNSNDYKLKEMFGAGAMCVVPEPTMLTKAGCVFVGTHSLDVIQASVRQVWTGRKTDTDTYNSAVALAESLGADRNTAMKVGLTVNLAIPVGFAIAIGAVRVAAIRGGRIKLAEHEAMTGGAGGGHTISKHVGKTPDELIARFNAEPKLKSSSSFRSMSEAESLISKVLRDNKHQIAMWVKNVPPGVPARMTLNRAFAHQTGITILKGSTEMKKCYGVRVILDFQPWHGKPYFVVTAYPVI